MQSLATVRSASTTSTTPAVLTHFHLRAVRSRSGRATRRRRRRRTPATPSDAGFVDDAGPLGAAVAGSSAPAATAIARTRRPIAPPARSNLRFTAAAPSTRASRRSGARPLTGSDCSDDGGAVRVGQRRDRWRDVVVLSCLGDASRKPTTIAAAAARPANDPGPAGAVRGATATSASIARSARVTSSMNPTGRFDAAARRARRRGRRGLPRAPPATPRRTRGAPRPRRVRSRCTHRRVRGDQVLGQPERIREFTTAPSRSRRRPRWMRDRTVPTGMPCASAISSYESPTTSHSTTAVRNSSGNAASASLHLVGEGFARFVGRRRSAAARGRVVRGTRRSDDGACGAPRPGTRSSRSGPTRPPTSQG